MTPYRLVSTQFERDTPSVNSGLYGARAAGALLDVAETRDVWETNTMTPDVWLRLVSGRWIPQRLGGHNVPYAERL